MAEEWERQVVIQELTERITNGDFAGAFDSLTQEIDAVGFLDDRDRQKLLQYWMSKERERGVGE
ncbi:MAG: hypothetical protein WBR18_03405 [Anaerolineales bacterium]